MSLFQHVDTAQKLLHPGERPPMAGLSSHIEKKRDLRKQINHHLHIILTEFSYPYEDLEIYFSLYSLKESSYVSEKVLLQPPVINNNNENHYNINGLIGAIFKDVGNLDQIRDLYLVCHVIRTNKLGLNNSNDSSFNTLTSSRKAICFRKPYACSVMNVSKIITKGVGTLMEFEAKLQMCDDKDFYHLHEQIIKKASGKFNPLQGSNPNSCVKISLRLVTGNCLFHP